MGDDREIPSWLKALPLAPVYRPTETEFADPIAFISRVEREAAAFGICKIVPPLPKPSKRFVLSNLNRSIASFTTRQQELGSSKRGGGARAHHKKQQVWQSGELYTLDQFEAKARLFARSHLGKDSVSPLLVETLFWKAATEKTPIYVEYANDVPGSGFSAPEERFRYHPRKRKKGSDSLSNSPWNLQVISRSRGSLTRFMPDEVPGVTSPMVYIGMLFSWFAWHIEDHELHSMNFLHLGSPKTWYAVPGDWASTVEEIVRVKGYGGNVDPLASFTMLGEKTTLLSPEVFLASGVPCCRLVQYPGEFVVTFPRAYHVGFSHGFNCGEAANFATPQWLNIAKEAAVRRASTNQLPMLSHQQLLYMITMSFISRVPIALFPGVRSSRLKDRKKEEREILVKKAFLDDMMNENHLLCALLAKESILDAVLWEPGLLPSPSTGSKSQSVFYGDGSEEIDNKLKFRNSFDCNTDNCSVEKDPGLTNVPCRNILSIDTQKSDYDIDRVNLNFETLEDIDVYEDDSPFGLSVDSGPLACVYCGILGYPFMAVVQPSERALEELSSVNSEVFLNKLQNSGCLESTPCLPDTNRVLNSDGYQGSSCILYPAVSQLLGGSHDRGSLSLLNNGIKESSSQIPTLESSSLPYSFDKKSAISVPFDSVSEDGHENFNPLNEDGCFAAFAKNKGTKFDNLDGLHLCNQLKELKGNMHLKDNTIAEEDSSATDFSGTIPTYKTDRLCGAPVERSGQKITNKWNTSNRFLRPRIFCLQHALQIEELLQCKGGANVLIICHSDYVKIKAHASSIAEEVGVEFNYKDAPLDKASAQDLDLINISIDGDPEEHIEDWTSKFGLNLRHRIKLRKQSTTASNQLPCASALGGLFNDPFPVSTLKWCSRKSRTPHKVIGIIQAKGSKLKADVNIENGEPELRKTNADTTKKLQVYRSRRTAVMCIAKKYEAPRVEDSERSKLDETVVAGPVKTSKVQQHIRNGFSDVSSLRKTDYYSEDLHEVPVAWAPNFNANSMDTIALDDQSIVPILSSNNFGIQLEVSIVEEPTMENTVSTVDNFELMQEDSAARENYGHCVSELNYSEVQKELHSPSKMEEWGIVIYDSKVADSTVEGPLVDSPQRQSAMSYSEEVGASVAVVQNSGVNDDTVENNLTDIRVDGDRSLQNGADRECGRRSIVVYKSYVRRHKRKMEADKAMHCQESFSSGFIRSPCEGLRPRAAKVRHEPVETKVMDKRMRKLSEQKPVNKRHHRFHHDDERPLKCSWKDCQKSFKWAWALTEHLRLHTGERPYKCQVNGCELTFRYISDFSRHRRKTGHSQGT